MSGPSKDSLDFAISVERRRCVDIIRKSAAVYRELAHHASFRETRLLARGQAAALEEAARDIEDA